MHFPLLFCFYSLHFLTPETKTACIAITLTRFCIFLIWACWGFIAMLSHSLKLQCQFICFATYFEGFYSWPQRHCVCVVVGNCNRGIFQLPLGVAVTSSSLLNISMFWGGWRKFMNICMKLFECLLAVLGMRSQGLDAQCRLLGTTHLTSGVHWLTPDSFAFTWHQPRQKVTTRAFWMGRTGYRGSWAIPPHQTWEPLYSISEKCSLLKKKGYVYAQQTSSWGVLQKDWYPSHCNFWWRKEFRSLECCFPEELLLYILKTLFPGC